MLSHIIGKRDVRVETHGEDRYGRTIGDVFVRRPNSAASDPEANLNFMMVANGYAWHYVRYAPDNKELADAEKHARELKLGLWADTSPIAAAGLNVICDEYRLTVDNSPCYARISKGTRLQQSIWLAEGLLLFHTGQLPFQLGFA